MEMKILLNKVDKIPKIKNKILIKKNKIKFKILPSFTKKYLIPFQNLNEKNSNYWSRYIWFIFCK